MGSTVAAMLAPVLGALLAATAAEAQTIGDAGWTRRADAAEAQAVHAEALFKLGRWDEGEGEIKAALAILGEPGNPPRLAEAAALGALGDAYLRWGRYDDARAALARALALREARQGPDHPDLTPVLGSLATLHLTLAEEGDAERLYRRRLAIAQRAEPAGGRLTIAAMLDLALLYSVTGRAGEALPLFDSAEAALARVDPRDPELANAYREHALSFVRLGRGAEAVALAQKALTATEAAFGPDTEAAGTAHVSLARVLFAAGRNAEAEAEGRRGLEIYRRALSPDNPRLGDAVFQLGFAAQRRLDRDNAERFYAEALMAMEGKRPDHHEAVINVRSSLSQQIMRGGKEPQRAYAISRQAADALRTRIVANARLVGRNGAPTVSAVDRNVFFIAVRSGWALGAAQASNALNVTTTRKPGEPSSNRSSAP